MLADALPPGESDTPPPQVASAPPSNAVAEALIARVRQAMGYFAGILRDESLLKQGIAVQAEIAADLQSLVEQHGKGSRAFVEAGSLLRIAHAILQSALARTESRGAHFRSDFPRRDDECFQKHSIYRGQDSIQYEAW
jgi:succinate dehydrogenase/fumarate reductase flavoprotein subunit